MVTANVSSGSVRIQLDLSTDEAQTLKAMMQNGGADEGQIESDIRAAIFNALQDQGY